MNSNAVTFKIARESGLEAAIVTGVTRTADGGVVEANNGCRKIGVLTPEQVTPSVGILTLAFTCAKALQNENISRNEIRRIYDFLSSSFSGKE